MRRSILQGLHNQQLAVKRPCEEESFPRFGTDSWRLDRDGMLTIPDSPGLGLDLNMDAVEKYTGERFGR